MASFLAPCDMASLALSCKRFGAMYGTMSSRAARLIAREAKKQDIKPRQGSLMADGRGGTASRGYGNAEKNALCVAEVLGATLDWYLPGATTALCAS